MEEVAEGMEEDSRGNGGVKHQVGVAMKGPSCNCLNRWSFSVCLITTFGNIQTTASTQVSIWHDGT